MKYIPSPVERRAVRKQIYYHFNVKQCAHNAEVYGVDYKRKSLHVQPLLAMSRAAKQ